MQPRQAAARPLCQGRERADRLVRGAVSATASTTRTKQNQSDSAPHVMKSVVINPFFDWGDDRHPRTAYHESVIYEAHVKGLTMRHPEIPESLRGTYSGIAHPATIDHLKRLGVTAIELMPVHQFVQDHHLQERGLRELLGLQHDRLPGPAQRVLLDRPARAAGARVQGDGQGAARRRHRGHPRRRLQPHGRGQRDGPDAVVPRPRQRRPTTASSTTTRRTTTTRPAPATACSCAVRTCCR